MSHPCEKQRHQFACELALDGDAADFHSNTATDTGDAIDEHYSDLRIADEDNRCAPRVYEHPLECPTDQDGFLRLGDSCYFVSIVLTP